MNWRNRKASKKSRRSLVANRSRVLWTALALVSLMENSLVVPVWSLEPAAGEQASGNGKAGDLKTDILEALESIDEAQTNAEKKVDEAIKEKEKSAPKSSTSEPQPQSESLSDELPEDPTVSGDTGNSGAPAKKKAKKSKSKDLSSEENKESGAKADEGLEAKPSGLDEGSKGEDSAAGEAGSPLAFPEPKMTPPTDEEKKAAGSGEGTESGKDKDKEKEKASESTAKSEKKGGLFRKKKKKNAESQDTTAGSGDKAKDIGSDTKAATESGKGDGEELKPKPSSEEGSAKAKEPGTEGGDSTVGESTTENQDTAKESGKEGATAKETEPGAGSETGTGTDAATAKEETIEELPRKRPVKVEKPTKKIKGVDHISKADSLILQHKYGEAEDAYRSLIDSDQSGDAYAGLAVALAKQDSPKKVAEAEQIMKRGKEEFGDNPNILAAGGFVSYIHSKQVASPARRDLYLEAAAALSKNALNGNPEIVLAHQTQGLVQLDQDSAEEAVSPLRKAARLAQDPDNLTLLAKALLKVDPTDEEAPELIEDALTIDENYFPARLQKSIVLTNNGKHEDAYAELHSIPKIDRESDWHSVQGNIFFKQGDGPSALASWKEANRLNPRNPDPYKKLAEYYAMRGDGELAISEMHNALEILPNDLKMRADLAELALRQDKLDVAEQEYRTILSVRPEDPSALLGLSRVFFRKARKEGQYPPDTQKVLDQIQNIITEQQVKQVRGSMLDKGAKNMKEKIQLSEAEKALAQGRFREARQLFSQVIMEHKEEPANLVTLADQAYYDGDLKSAEQAFNYAKELPEVGARAEQGISKISSQRSEALRHTKLGQATQRQLPAVAIDHFKQALIADNQCADAFYWLFKLFARQKDGEKQATENAMFFLEAAEDSDSRRREVEDELSKLKRRVRKTNSK